jgi:hypothetical protein
MEEILAFPEYLPRVRQCLNMFQHDLYHVVHSAFVASCIIRFLNRKESRFMKAISIALAFALLTVGVAPAQDHGAMMAGGVPNETGQATFAAIQEIVTLLDANPATDWAKVDIEALRQHLIDMNNVTLGAVVEAAEMEGSVRFSVSGDGPVRESVRRMVMAHAVTMNGFDGWKFAAESSDSGAVLTVSPPDQASMVKLRALGFIGMMTRGMHHQQHHWMLATGMGPHQ